MKRSLGVRYLIVIQQCTLLVVNGAKLPRWHVHAHCGDHISQSDTAGTLLLEENKLPKGLGYGECKLIVSPKTLPGDGSLGRILFYFTEFEFPEPCSEFNVTIQDGTPFNASRLKGAPNPLCRHNASLTKAETFFTTSGPNFVVMIRWMKTQSWRSGGFVLKFSSYYDGQCNNMKGVTRCVNNRCTPSEFHCHFNIDTCGPWERRVCDIIDKEEVEESGNGTTFSYVATIIFILVAFPVIGACLMKGMAIWRKIAKFSYSQPSRRSPSPFRETGPQSDTEAPLNPPDSGDRQSSVQDDVRPSSVQHIEIQPSVEDDQSSIYSSDSSDTRDQTAPPPPYDSLALVPYTPAVPSAPPSSPPTTPPPSYDTVSLFTSSPQSSAPPTVELSVSPYSPPSPPPSYDTVSPFQPSSQPATPSSTSDVPPPAYDTISNYPSS